MKMNHTLRITILVSMIISIGCAGGPKPYRHDCATELDLAWQELSIAEAEGFAGTVSYSKAFSLLTAAKTMPARISTIAPDTPGMPATISTNPARVVKSG